MGKLKHIKATELGSYAIKGAVTQSGIEPEEVDELFFGSVLQAGLG